MGVQAQLHAVVARVEDRVVLDDRVAGVVDVDRVVARALEATASYHAAGALKTHLVRAAADEVDVEDVHPPRVVLDLVATVQERQPTDRGRGPGAGIDGEDRAAAGDRGEGDVVGVAGHDVLGGQGEALPRDHEVAGVGAARDQHRVAVLRDVDGSLDPDELARNPDRCRLAVSCAPQASKRHRSGNPEVPWTTWPPAHGPSRSSGVGSRSSNPKAYAV